MIPLPPPRTDWRSRYGLRSRLGWAVLAVVVVAGVYELLGLLFPSLPGAVGVSPRPSVTTPSPAITVSPTASPRPDASSPAPGQTSPSTMGPRVIVVQPQRGDRGPAGQPGAVVIVTTSPTPQQTPPPSSPSPRPSPSPPCTVAVSGRCVVPGLSP